MKRSSRIGFGLLMALVLLLSGCIQWTPESAESSVWESQTQEPTATSPIGKYKDVEYSYGTDGAQQFANQILTTGMSQSYLLLANKTHPLGENYVPPSLITLTCATPYDEVLEMEAHAAQALYLMLDEMAADGVSGVKVTSAYRSYAYQKGTFNHHVQAEIEYTRNTGLFSPEAYACLGYSYIKTQYLDRNVAVLTYADAVKVALSYSALAGTSEHQTGLCVDLITDETGDHLSRLFEETEAFAWLSENAYRFGFVLRYPEDKEEVTGYTYEPWHYRFVGREAATDMHLAKLTLEEYLALLET